MKFAKIFAIALAIVSLSACSDDEDSSWNTAPNESVSMLNAQMSIGEDLEAGRYYNIPIAVTGEANGPIRVFVEIKAVSSSPATEGEDFIVTEKETIIAAGENQGNIQFYPIGDNIINEDRQFVCTIVKAEGATIGSQLACTVTLKDNERLIPDAYRKIQGIWTFHANDEGPVEFDLECIGANEGEEGYLTDLLFVGWNGYNWVMTNATFSYDGSTNSAVVSFPLGQWIAKNVNFGSLGICNVLLASVKYSADGATLVSKGSLTCTSDEDITRLDFSSDAEMVGAIFSGTSFTGQVWFWYDTMYMTRKSN